MTRYFWSAGSAQSPQLDLYVDLVTVKRGQ